MSFPEKENSRNQGEPVQLYLFSVGPGRNSGFYYTDSEKPITFDAMDGFGPRTFNPIAVDRGKIESKGTLDRSRMDIILPENDPLAAYFRQGIPSFIVTCRIFNGHLNDVDAEFVSAWVGRIVGSKSTSGRTTLTGLPVVSDIRRTGLRRNYQFGCTHALYDPATCRADKAAATVTTNVVSASGNRVVLPAGWNGSHPVSGFSNGAVFEWSLPVTKYKFWRITVNSTFNGPEDSVALTEIAMRDAETGQDLIGGGTPFASSVSIDLPGAMAANAFDGNPFTGWVSRPLAQQHIGYEFAEPVSVTGVSISAADATSQFPQNAFVEASHDGIAYEIQAVLTLDEQPSAQESVAFPNMELDREIRTVRQIDSSGTILTLNAPVRNLPAGERATLFLGCNRQQTDCRALHNNIKNFGGCPRIPTESPLGVNNQFY